MASNKNQHFVPRCYLRRFTIDEADKAINLYNIDRDRFIEGAPVKNQCSGDYFYGDDPRLEKAIQATEGMYAATARAVLQPGYVLRDDDRHAMLLFWLMQHLRTEAASRRAVEMSDAMLSVAGGVPDGYRLQIREAVQMAMRVFFEAGHMVLDMKACLVRNRSAIPFVTSDDPAVLTNRWRLQGPRSLGPSFGLQAAGDILLLPISPSVLFLAYDGDIYSVQQASGWVQTSRENDIDALNQHQYLNARANVFVRSPEDFDNVRSAFKASARGRVEARHRVNYAVLKSQEGDTKTFVAIKPEEAPDHEQALIHTETIHLAPAAWPRFLGWRPKPCAFTNNTGIGHVRRAWATTDDGSPPFRKVAARL